MSTNFLKNLNSQSLYEIGKKHNSDKSTHHLFTLAYDLVFLHFRFDPIHLLEIGVLDGASLKMWAEYFPFGSIYGVDIKDTSHFNTERIKTFVADQANPDQLKKLPFPLHIIVDDGGHTMLQQQISLVHLFPHLLSNGIYVIEDLHTSLPPYGDKYGNNGNNSTIQLLQDLENKQKSPNASYYMTDEEFNYLLNSIQFIKIIKSKHKSITSFLVKK